MLKGVKENHVTLVLTKKVEYLDSLIYAVIQHLLSADDAELLEVYSDETGA